MGGHERAPQSPQRSERLGKAVALLDMLAGYRDLYAAIYCGLMVSWPIVAAAVTERASLSPTIVQLMEGHVSLRFDRGLIERLHRQRPDVDQQDAPDLCKLFSLFAMLVNNVWGGVDPGST